MKISKLHTIYFSATGTTKKVADTLASAICIRLAEKNCLVCDKPAAYDFTLPSARESFPVLEKGELVIFGMPTYAGRLPNLMLPYFDLVKGNDAFAVPFVTFGNRAFENSLIELCGLLEERQFHTISGGAFSCEHSFSYELAKERPDEQDLSEITAFGIAVADKLIGITDSTIPEPAAVDGDINAGYYKPKDATKAPIDIRKVKPDTDLSKCISCGLCAASCPMGSIDKEDFSLVSGKCIKCCACMKKCPTGAKFFSDPGFLYHKTELEKNYGTRRASNSLFL